MGFFSKLLTALRGAANEAGEAAVDQNAIRILEQELRDAAAANDDAKQSLAAIMGKKKVSEQRLDALQADYDRRMDQVRAALDKDEEDLAREVATAVKDIEAKGVQEQDVIAAFERTIADLRAAIKENDGRIDAIRREVDTVKANDALVRAEAAVAGAGAGANSSLGDAADSLARIKARQAESRARIEAANELAGEGASLDRKLAEAGITDRAGGTDDVLAAARAGEPKKLGSR